MIEVQRINFDCKTVEGYIVHPDEGDMSEFYFDEVEVMQFTGLKDKNGKEIWESDILQYMNNEGKLTDIYFVEWNKRGFVGRWSKRKEGEFNNCDGLDCPEKDMEIIGNIYENPELLTK